MIQEKNYKRYEGKRLLKATPKLSYETEELRGVVREQKKVFEEKIPPYFPSDALKDAVEYARILQRPLLLRGEPGSGKTRLAQAVAYELYRKDYRSQYFEWYIKSSTKARDGLYTFDHLARLRDVELARHKNNGEPQPGKEDLFRYRKFGPLGQAYLASKPDKPAILLIDEIDKADLDFPNDLLFELEQKRFFVEETSEEIVAEYPPLIFITSNDEKDLPNAFLRRCVFFYIDFPGEELLMDIAKANAGNWAKEYKKAMPDKLIEDIVNRFRQLYTDMKNNPNTDKAPSTSELIDWLRVLYYQFLQGRLEGESLPKGELPHPEVLLKSLDDYKTQTNK
ncbi:MAG: MoxR family ATPase [Phaeodactylibacter sp.]|nr:MoxR family ATPase [Phaeodactylibacter sp.]MCB9289364.1 MoxR family ATPase [Lewinellaceae bacterium]